MARVYDLASYRRRREAVEREAHDATYRARRVLHFHALCGSLARACSDWDDASYLLRLTLGVPQGGVC